MPESDQKETVHNSTGMYIIGLRVCMLYQFKIFYYPSDWGTLSYRTQKKHVIKKNEIVYGFTC